LELFQFELLHNVITKDVGGSEEPASSAALLIRDTASIKLDLTACQQPISLQIGNYRYLIVEDVGYSNLGGT
jgi:hypothetical protein